MPIEDRVNVDDDVEDNDVVKADAVDADFDNFDPLDMNIEAHPANSVCDTEDVAADQATLVIDESMATHTEILSVTNQIPELGEEVDQEAKSVSSEKIIETAVEKDEATAENQEEDVLVEHSAQNAVLAEEEVAECPRTVPHPDKRYKLNVVASDSSGGLEIILGDREVRTLIGKRARDLYDEVKKNQSLPADLQQIRKKDYTVVLRIREINVVHHFQVYWAANICSGFFKPIQQTDETMNDPQTSNSQVTSSTYNLQGLSDLNFQSS
ncbi:hypothetical protein POM88_053651 [Heracleum sosnowskyi]|uniref:Uncharacterized protein n=1 Tax=Heracleum sosnowskyi TaxID=360622 RepID=A0AAD8GNL8_9APIA|nr:hypothetical protein POM88_053651 [Heracleum sosnowskyi]